MPLVPNNTKRKMQAGSVALGFGVHHLRSVAAPVLAAATGHDWLFLDNEHGSFSVNEIAQLCIASLPTGVTPLVRVCANAIEGMATTKTGTARVRQKNRAAAAIEASMSFSLVG